jgi:ribosome maturation factor RimP
VKTKEKTIAGKLAAVHENEIEILEQTGAGKKREEKLVVIPFEQIEKTFVLVSFK